MSVFHDLVLRNSRTRILESVGVGNLSIICTHAILPQQLLKVSVHATLVNKLTKIMFRLFVNNINTKCFIKIFRRSDTSQPIAIFIDMIPILS